MPHHAFQRTPPPAPPPFSPSICNFRQNPDASPAVAVCVRVCVHVCVRQPLLIALCVPTEMFRQAASAAPMQ